MTFSLHFQPLDAAPPWPSISFLILIAALILASYILWRRYQSRQSLVQRIAELEMLSASGRALVEAELDVTALCQLIATEAGNVIDNSTFQIGLFEEHFYQILFWTINEQPQPTPQTFDLSEDGGIVGWMRHSRQALLVHDFRREAETLPASPRYVSDNPPRSAIFIPLISGDQVLGSLAAQSHQPHRFSEEDMRRLMILANQAAAAIANARLYEQVEQRAVQLELVRGIARQVNAVSDLEEIFDEVVQLTHDIFGFHPVNIFAMDEANEQLVIKASSATRLPIDEYHVAPGQGIVGTAVATRQTIVVNNTSEDDRFRVYPNPRSGSPPLVTQAEMAVPLLVNDDVLGALDVGSERLGAFGLQERTVLEALAAEVASAIHKARQLARQKERAWLTTAQLQVAAALSRSNNPEEIATAVTRLTTLLTSVRCCGVWLWEEENDAYRGLDLYDTHQQSVIIDQIEIALGDWPPLDAAHVGGEPITTEHVPGWLPPLLDIPAREIKSLTLLPIEAKSEPLGLMLVDATPFSEDEAPVPRQRELLEDIAEQTGHALETTLLRQAQQEEAWVNTVLLQVAEAVNSRIDLNEILNTIVRLVPMLVGVSSIIILIWDEDREVFLAGPSHGLSAMGRGLLETLEPTAADLPITEQSDVSRPGPQGRTISLSPPPWMEKVLGAKQVYALPLNARGRLVGALLVGGGANGRPFSQRRLSILNGIAHQAATAVANHRLYQEAAERERLAQELHVAHEIQASLIPDGRPNIPGCSVASFWQAARQVSGDFYDFIHFSDQQWGIVIADVADKGVPAALFMALSRTILRTVAFNRSDPAQVLMRTNDIIDSEAQSDLFVTVFYAVWEAQSGALTYANGGHNPPLLLRHNGQTEELHGRGIALGVLSDVEIETRSVQLEPDDIVIFYTDGVTEAMNEDYDEFGLDRMLFAARHNREGDAQQIMGAITDAVRDHAGDTPQFDDITLVVLKYQGVSAPSISHAPAQVQVA